MDNYRSFDSTLAKMSGGCFFGGIFGFWFSLFTMRLPKGEKLAVRKFCFSFLNPANMREIEWFRPEREALGGHYGRFHGVYSLSLPIDLINLGSAADRALVLLRTTLSEEDLRPDVQYSGGAGNLKVHRAIFDSEALSTYHGTIVASSCVDKCLAEDLEGVEEVVLFIPRLDVGVLNLVEVREDGEV
jgi:hypothetical protein